MNIYLLTQTDNGGYDTYDSCVVIAASEREAKNIDPSGEGWSSEFSSWASSPDKVEASLIGVSDLPEGVVLTSFNAG